MYISTIEEFINKYFNALALSMEEPTDKVVKFFKSIIKIRPNINVDFDSSGTPNFSLSFNNKEKKKTLEDVLNIPLAFAKDYKTLVLLCYHKTYIFAHSILEIFRSLLSNSIPTM